MPPRKMEKLSTPHSVVVVWLRCCTGASEHVVELNAVAAMLRRTKEREREREQGIRAEMISGGTTKKKKNEIGWGSSAHGKKRYQY